MSRLHYNLTAPTTHRNLTGLLRGAILLEGSPGVEKSSLAETVARLSGHRLVRINLSEQTDLVDLMRSDLPAPSPSAVEETTSSDDVPAGTSAPDARPPSTAGSVAPVSEWRDGIFPVALKRGNKVLLDEPNPAPQLAGAGRAERVSGPLRHGAHQRGRPTLHQLRVQGQLQSDVQMLPFANGTELSEPS